MFEIKEKEIKISAKNLDAEGVIQSIDKELDKSQLMTKILNQKITLSKSKIKNEQEMLEYREFLTFSKSELVKITAIFKNITAPAYNFKKQLDARLKQISESVKELNELTESKVLDFVVGQEVKRNYTPEVKGMTTKTTRVVNVEDINKLDAKYLIVNTELILSDLERGVRIDGITIEEIFERKLRG
jgi:hypothetical protein